MADTKITALTSATTLAGTEILAGSQSAASVGITANQLKTWANNAPVIAAGTASAGTWPVYTAGTVLTSPVAGALEVDATNFYLTTEASNRGIVQVTHFIRANATRTFTSNTAMQAIFTTPANGTLTLGTGVYVFDGLIVMDTMSATNGNGKFSLIGAGTATLTQILMFTMGADSTSDTSTAVSGSFSALATQSQANAVLGSTTLELGLHVRGSFNVSVTGTIIPSFSQTTANAAVLKIGSYFRCRRLGAQAVTSVGNWS